MITLRPASVLSHGITFMHNSAWLCPSACTLKKIPDLGGIQTTFENQPIEVFHSPHKGWSYTLTAPVRVAARSAYWVGLCSLGCSLGTIYHGLQTLHYTGRVGYYKCMSGAALSRNQAKQDLRDHFWS